MNKDILSNLESQIEPLQGVDSTEIEVKAPFLLEELKGIISGSKELIKQNDILRIGVVGQVKAGKSSFLNSLIFDGESILPKASTPMTAGLTIIEYAEDNSFEVDFYTKDDWAIFEQQATEYIRVELQIKEAEPELSSSKEIDARLREVLGEEVCSAKELYDRCNFDAKKKIGTPPATRDFSGSTEELQKLLENYVGADGKYTSVSKSITLRLNKPELKGIQIVDTPGVNDPIISRENRTKEFLRACHGVFLLSYAGRFCDSSDMDFLNNRISGEGIGSIVILASKFDSVLQEASRQYNGELVDCFDGVKAKLEHAQTKAISNTDYKGVQPIFDTTSGISFSIYKKDKPDWDEMERHVVQQMAKLFPEYFNLNDLEELKDTFNSISNLDDIKEKYLEKEFKDKKDKIISEKNEQFYISSFERLNKFLVKEQESVKNRIAKLNSTSIESLEQIEKDNKLLFGAVEEKIKLFIENELTSLKGIIKKFNINSSSWRYPQIEIQNVRDSITHDGIVYDSNLDFTYKKIDTYGSLVMFKKSFEAHLFEINKAWSKIFSEDCGVFYEKLNTGIYNQIKEYKKSVRENNIDSMDTEEWLNVISRTLTEISSNDTLPINKIKSASNKKISSLFDSGKFEFNPNLYVENWSKRERAEKRDSVTNKADKIIRKSESEIDDLVEYLEGNLEKEISHLHKEVKEVLKDLKSNIVSNIQKASEEYTAKLKIELKNKEENIKKYDEYLTILNSLSLSVAG